MTAQPDDHNALHAGDVAVLDFTSSWVQHGINALMEVCERADGHLPFGDHELLAIAAGTRLGHVGFGAQRDGMLAGYGHLSKLGDAWFCEIAVHPLYRGKALGTYILDAIVGYVAANGGGTLSTWAYRRDGPANALLRHGKMEPVRTLYQMRLAELPQSAPPLPPGYALDTFDAERDRDAWLALNAKAFADLPDQGSWTERDLATRLSAPWYRAGDVLLVRRADGGLAGTCWCKVDEHARTEDGRQIGEIYVIALDPDEAGGGLGRILALTGLAHMRTRGAAAGMLYADSRNDRAIGLYRSLGFVIHHEDVCLATNVAAS